MDQGRDVRLSFLDGSKRWLEGCKVGACRRGARPCVVHGSLSNSAKGVINTHARQALQSIVFGLGTCSLLSHLLVPHLPAAGAPIRGTGGTGGLPGGRPWAGSGVGCCGGAQQCACHGPAGRRRGDGCCGGGSGCGWSATGRPAGAGGVGAVRAGAAAAGWPCAGRQAEPPV